MSALSARLGPIARFSTRLFLIEVFELAKVDLLLSDLVCCDSVGTCHGNVIVFGELERVLEIL